MKLATHILVLMAAKKDSNHAWKAWRHVGIGFHIGCGGMIATCRHVVNSITGDECLVACEVTSSRLVLPVHDVRCHEVYDFAIGKVNRPSPVAFPTIYSGNNLYVGDDVMAFGYFCTGKVAGSDSLNLVGRLFKGHIVRIDGTVIPNISLSTCELSFPSITGFSGTPLLHEKDCILGMLHGNHESSIQVHQYQEFVTPTEKHAESIHRVIELGLAHTAMDIRKFLLDLGVDNIPPGPSDAQLNTKSPW